MRVSRGGVPADPNMDTPKLSRDDGHAFIGVGIVHPQEIIGKPAAELQMNPADEVCRQGRGGSLSSIDQPLHLDVGDRLALQIPPTGIGRIVTAQRPVDVDGVGVVSLDQLRIVAVHRADEVADAGAQDRGSRPARPLDLPTSSVATSASTCLVSSGTRGSKRWVEIISCRSQCRKIMFENGSLCRLEARRLPVCLPIVR